ncbi:hypothetical protein Syun_031102 [Stephania yunnanensis]|uniref:Uncharacterized protein n=1 Tax=Stephania yunnanensis TaxID=152371 RepID=A0AAP0E251_9MAGN
MKSKSPKYLSFKIEAPQHPALVLLLKRRTFFEPLIFARSIASNLRTSDLSSFLCSVVSAFCYVIRVWRLTDLLTFISTLGLDTETRGDAPRVACRRGPEVAARGIRRVADQAKRGLVTTSEPVEDCYGILFQSALRSNRGALVRQGTRFLSKGQFEKLDEGTRSDRPYKTKTLADTLV